MQHLGFIMDGNGRWAQRKGMPRLAGHRAGVETLQKLLPELPVMGITHATFYAFSTENWRRPLQEVNGLMAIAREYFKSQLKKIKEDNVKIDFIGDHSAASPIPADIRQIMQEVKEETANNTGLTAIFAFNYGGQDELLRAANALRDQAKPISMDDFANALDTGKYPPIDLIIRTAGEKRLSNFVLWQAAYAELAFTDTKWPDLTAQEVSDLIKATNDRERRFGQTSAQVAKLRKQG